MAKPDEAEPVGTAPASLAGFIDQEPFWVIWQVSQPAKGGNSIRRISQNYATEARAEADAERYRKSGAITWVEQSRPLAPAHVPAEAMAALGAGLPPKGTSVSTIGAGS